MDKPKRIDNEKYNRILELSLKVKEKRPVEGDIINKLVLHIEELYEYLDWIQSGDDGTLDDDALERLGVKIDKKPARARGARPRRNVARGSAGGQGWQATPTRLDYLDDLNDPPF